MSRITGLTRLGVALVLAAAPLAGAAVLAGPVAQAQTDSPAVRTKPITNFGKGTTSDATVRVNHTGNLFDRQQVEIDLAGFLPTWNANNTAANGNRMQYPVVVMQCYGDNPERTACIHDERGVWFAGFDAQAPAEQRAVSEAQREANDVSPYPGTNDEQAANFLRASQLPFRDVHGINFLWSPRRGTNGQPLIDQPALKSFPPTDVTSEGSATINTRNVPIRPNGTNEFLFEVREKSSQSSLGCTDTQKCSIVVVPIMDMACVDPLPAKAADCATGPRGPEPGSQDGGTDSYNRFVSSTTWVAESNWRNRFVVPISFAPDLRSCDVRDSRPAIQAFGSELVSVAQARWGAAYCTGLRQSDYLPLYSQGSEYFGRRQIKTKLGGTYQQDAVFVTQPVTESPRPIAHAPTVVTGFAVAFAVDDGNGRQVQQMTLSPRLLAKLITQSYNPGQIVVQPNDREGKRPYTGTQAIPDQATANKYYVAHPALFNNPRSLFVDPEFADLNPDFVLNTSGSIAPQLLDTINPMLFTVESDVMMDVTRYIASDPQARAWLDGQPDDYGMRVNPAWLGMRPTQLYTLLDSWVRPAMPRKEGWQESGFGVLANRWFMVGGGDSCDEFHQTPFMTKVANISNSLKAATLLLLDRRGSATPVCTQVITPVPEDQQPKEPQFDGDDVTQDVQFNEAKNAPADFGRRAMLTLTTVSHAQLYELPTAKLVNAGGKAVAPTPGTMVNALHAAVQDPVTGTIEIDHTKVTGADWYPGTMTAFLAVPTAGLDHTTAARYADYIEFMATTGQVPGPTLANLPPGYDPLPKAMVQQAKAAAKAVRDQLGEVPAPPPGGPLADGVSDVVDQPSPNNPGSGLPATTQGPADKDGNPAKVAKTETASSWLAQWAIPLLIGFGLLAGLVSFLVQVGSQADHPVRRRLDWLVRTVSRR